MGYWNRHETRKMRAAELAPGMCILYRLRWHEVVDYEAERQTITLCRPDTSLATEKLSPTATVIVTDDECPDAD